MQVNPDTAAAGSSTAYDTVWAAQEPTHGQGGLETVMLSNDKLLVVLVVVLIIWFGLMFFVLRTDKKLQTLEREMAERIGSDAPDSSLTP